MKDGPNPGSFQASSRWVTYPGTKTWSNGPSPSHLVGDVDVAYQVTGEGPYDQVFVPGYVTHLELAWKLPQLR